MWRVCLERSEAGAGFDDPAQRRANAASTRFTNLPWRAGRPAPPAAGAAGARGDQDGAVSAAPASGAFRRLLAGHRASAKREASHA